MALTEAAVVEGKPVPLRRRLQAASEVPELVLQGLEALRPLTVLRAPRGYGKTVAIRKWLGQRTDARRLIDVSLTEQSHTEPGFWEELGRHLQQHGITAAASVDSRWATISGLLRHNGPVLLVIDDFHQAGLRYGATAIDDDLVDIVRQNEAIDLIVLTRSYRSLETTGLLSVDGVVLGPEELRLTAPMVLRLAEQMGYEFTLDRAEEIAVDTGGWPAAIRAALMRADSDGVLDAHLVDGYVTNMLSDPSAPGEWEFLLRSAVPSRFTVETLRRIAPEHDPLPLLRELRATGLLLEAKDGARQVYSYVPAVRRALLQAAAEREPDLLREVHRQLMYLAAEERAAVQELEHAIEAQDFDAALMVIKREWGSLLAIAPQTLQEAARRFPPERAQSEPHLRIVLQHLASAPQAASGRWGVGASDAFVANLQRYLPRSKTPELEEVNALLQWAVTCVLCGNLDSAIYVFNRARTLALTDEEPSEAVAFATVGLALAHALDGEPELTLNWLKESVIRTRLSAADHDGSDPVVVAAGIARVVALTDAGGFRAQRALAQLQPPIQRDDLWAATVFARAHLAVIGDDVAAMSMIAHEVRVAMRHVARGSLAEEGLAATLVELLIATDAVEVANEVARRFDNSALAWAAQAKAAFACRHYDDAIQLAQRALATPRRAWRTTVECHVVLTIAHHASGDDSAARESFRHAARLAMGTGQRRPFLLMPPYLFDNMVAEDPSVQDLWPRGVSADAPVVMPGPDLRSLTGREMQILQLLEEHSGPVGIGRELELSTNTIKTHLRAIYRKLGVTNRAAALQVVGSQRGMQ